MEPNTDHECCCALNTARTAVQLIAGARLDLSTEKHLQEGLAVVLGKLGVPVEREKRLGPFDIPDFFLAGAVVVECKMRGKAKKMDIWRQLVRYAAHEQVRAIVLATNVSMDLPREIEGKPVFIASLSTGWL